MDHGVTLSFWELITEKAFIVIPRIQRDYAQGRENEEQIRENFLSALHSTIISPGETISLNFVYGFNEKNELIPLDGQQRLTTLLLLHLYASWHHGNFCDVKDYFAKFRYEIRESTSDFMEKLCTYEPDKDTVPSVWFKNQPWFPETWDIDPTISSMLVMLDAIHNMFQDVIQVLWQRLVDDKAVVFEFVEVEQLGMTDEIYIKMNSTGLPLTEYEKAKNVILEIADKILGQSSQLGQELTTGFEITWTDYLWTYHNYDGEYHLIDSFFLNAIDYVLNIISCLNMGKAVPRKSNRFKTIKAVLTNSDSIHQFVTLMNILTGFASTDDGAYFKNFVSEHHEENHVAVFDDKLDYLKTCITSSGDFSFRDQIMLYAFIRKEALTLDDDTFLKRLRNLRNVLWNSSDYLRQDFLPAQLKEVGLLIENGQFDEENSKFNRAQIGEELAKRKLTDSRQLEELYALEDTELLQGSIAVVGIENAAMFAPATAMLNIANGNKALFFHALLATGDYHLRYRNKWYFCTNAQLDTARRILTASSSYDGFERVKNTFLSLVSNISDISEQGLQSIIDNVDFSNMKKDWRYYMLRYPEIMTKSTYGLFNNQSLESDSVPANGEPPFHTLTIMGTPSNFIESNSWNNILYAVKVKLEKANIDSTSIALSYKELKLFLPNRTTCTVNVTSDGFSINRESSMEQIPASDTSQEDIVEVLVTKIEKYFPNFTP